MAKLSYGPKLLTDKNGKGIFARTHNQLRAVEAIDSNVFTIITGSAGSGKTFCSAVMAVKYLTEGLAKKIIVTRPAVNAQNENLGFLPGDLKEKMDPFLQPIYDIFEQIKMPKDKALGAKTDRMEKTARRGPKPKMESEAKNDTDIDLSGQIQVVPFAYMRGRTFGPDYVIISDESQNCTVEQMKLLMTRIGEGSKMIISGDLLQSDIRGENGLSYIVNQLERRPIDDVEIVHFGKEDIVRNTIIAEIEEMFELSEIKNSLLNESTEFSTRE